MRSYTAVLFDTKPICWRTRDGCVRTSNPLTVAMPAVGRSTVLRIRRTVVLPAPFGPSSPYTCPGNASKLTRPAQ